MLCTLYTFYYTHGRLQCRSPLAAIQDNWVYSKNLHENQTAERFSLTPSAAKIWRVTVNHTKWNSLTNLNRNQNKTEFESIGPNRLSKFLLLKFIRVRRTCTWGAILRHYDTLSHFPPRRLCVICVLRMSATSTYTKKKCTDVIQCDTWKSTTTNVPEQREGEGIFLFLVFQMGVKWTFFASLYLCRATWATRHLYITQIMKMYTLYKYHNRLWTNCVSMQCHNLEI